MPSVAVRRTGRWGQCRATSNRAEQILSGIGDNRPRETQYGKEDFVTDILDCQEEDSFDKNPVVQNQTPVEESRQDSGPEICQRTHSGNKEAGNPGTS